MNFITSRDLIAIEKLIFDHNWNESLFYLWINCFNKNHFEFPILSLIQRDEKLSHARDPWKIYMIVARCSLNWVSGASSDSAFEIWMKKQQTNEWKSSLSRDPPPKFHKTNSKKFEYVKSHLSSKTLNFDFWFLWLWRLNSFPQPIKLCAFVLIICGRKNKNSDLQQTNENDAVLKP